MKQLLLNKKIVIITILLCIATIFFTTTKEKTIPVALAEEIPEKIYIDIKGEVNNPGVYEVKEDNRVEDAIKIAGGLTNSGDTTSVNLSTMLFNEMVIIIPSKKENIKITNDAEIDIELQVINLNTATLEELMSLNGIGLSKAEAIIEYRTKIPFNNIEEIINVPGIGVATYEKNKDRLSL